MRTYTDEACRRVQRAVKKHGNHGLAAAALGISRPTVHRHLYEGVRRGLYTMEDALTGHPKANLTKVRQAKAAVGQPEPPADPIELRRLREQLKGASDRLAAAERRALAAEDLRAGILALGKPKKAALAPDRPPQSGGARDVLFHLSDIQYAEVIDPEEVDGLNSYNVEIANRRLAKGFHTVARLMTDYWSGKRAETLHLMLGGDLVSGGIHGELMRTDELMRLPSARAVAEQIAAGVRLIRKKVKCRVKVYSVPGNHGRLTIKPEAKGAAIDSLDTLVAWLLEAALADDDEIEVLYGESVDCVFKVFGYPILLSHGDRMGSRGGQGFLGPIATILRGQFKLRADYAGRGIRVYRMFTGHLHTSCRLSFGYGNGSVAGWSDYARDLRAEKEPAQQTYAVLHSELGMIEERQILMGSPEEGSIYRGFGSEGWQAFRSAP